MNNGIWVVVVLAIAGALISVMYHLRPKPAAEQAVASNGQTPNPSAASEAPKEMETSNWPELFPLPLAPIVIEPENGMWRTNSDYADLPHGTQSFGGIQFVFDGILQLRSLGLQAFNRSFRTSIALPVAEAGAAQRSFASIHLNCGTRSPSGAKSTVAELVWHYTDGQSRSVPIVYQ